MAELNLLQTDNTQKAQASNLVNNSLNVLGVVVLAVVLVMSAILYINNRNLTKQIADASQQQNSTESNFQHQSGYAKLISSQQKLKDLQSLLKQHSDWSSIITKFASATLANTELDNKVTSAIYNKFSANSDGGVEISGTVGSFADLDRLIKGFELQDFDSFITDVRLTNVGTSKDNNAVTFTLDISFNKDILNAYTAQQGSSNQQSAVQPGAVSQPIQK